jgi:hypothetical protein
MACRDNDKGTPEKDEDDENNNNESNGSGFRSFEFKRFQRSLWHSPPPVSDLPFDNAQGLEFIERPLNGYIFDSISPKYDKMMRHTHVPISPPLSEWPLPSHCSTPVPAPSGLRRLE